MSDKKPFRVMMWCVPRTVSTAVTKCFSFIDNTQIWFEPYSANFITGSMLQQMGLRMPEKPEDIDDLLTKLDAMTKGTTLEDMIGPNSMDKSLVTRSCVQDSLHSLPSDKNVFVKDMAFAITDHYSDLPNKESGFRHTFLIRDPELMFPSWRNLLLQMAQMVPGPPPPNVETFDLRKDVPYMMPGFTYKCQYDFWNHVKENFDPNPVVIDADEILSNPAAILSKYCEAVGIPWDDKYLQWDPSPPGAREWKCPLTMNFGANETGMASIHQMALTSSQFSPAKPKITRSRMTPDAIEAIDETMRYYQEMYAARITF